MQAGPCCAAMKPQILWSEATNVGVPEKVRCRSCGVDVPFADYVRAIPVRDDFVSSNVKAIGFTTETDQPVLRVDFKNGGQYAYIGVPRPTWEGLLAADSKGIALNRIVKGVFKGYKLAPAAA